MQVIDNETMFKQMCLIKNSFFALVRLLQAQKVLSDCDAKALLDSIDMDKIFKEEIAKKGWLADG